MVKLNLDFDVGLIESICYFLFVHQKDTTIIAIWWQRQHDTSLDDLYNLWR